MVPVGKAFCGRVLDGLGNPMDDLGPVKTAGFYPIMNNPPSPLERNRITEKLSLGIKAIVITSYSIHYTKLYDT